MTQGNSTKSHFRVTFVFIGVRGTVGGSHDHKFRPELSAKAKSRLPFMSSNPPPPKGLLKNTVSSSTLQEAAEVTQGSRILCCHPTLRSRPPFTGVLLGPGPESAPRSAFWAILGTCLGVPQRVLFECFLAFLGPKTAKKHSKSTLWGTPRQVAKIAQKALRGALSGPGPKSTPVNGGRDRKPNSCPSAL